jgi:hypothetical protein
VRKLGSDAGVSGAVTLTSRRCEVAAGSQREKKIMRRASILPSARVDSVPDAAPKAASVVVVAPELN